MIRNDVDANYINNKINNYIQNKSFKEAREIALSYARLEGFDFGEAMKRIDKGEQRNKQITKNNKPKPKR